MMKSNALMWESMHLSGCGQRHQRDAGVTGSQVSGRTGRWPEEEVWHLCRTSEYPSICTDIAVHSCDCCIIATIAGMYYLAWEMHYWAWEYFILKNCSFQNSWSWWGDSGHTRTALCDCQSVLFVGGAHYSREVQGEEASSCPGPAGGHWCHLPHREHTTLAPYTALYCHTRHSSQQHCSLCLSIALFLSLTFCTRVVQTISCHNNLMWVCFDFPSLPPSLLSCRRLSSTCPRMCWLSWIIRTPPSSSRPPCSWLEASNTRLRPRCPRASSNHCVLHSSRSVCVWMSLWIYSSS